MGDRDPDGKLFVLGVTELPVQFARVLVNPDVEVTEIALVFVTPVPPFAAVKAVERVSAPVKLPVPFTVKVWLAVVVPIATLPAEVTRMRSVWPV